MFAAIEFALFAGRQRRPQTLCNALTEQSRVLWREVREDSILSVVFHSAPVAIMIVRLSDGHLIDVNSAFAELWGYAREQVLGRTSNELQLWIQPENLIPRLRETRYADTQELRIRQSSGASRDALVSVTMIQFDGSAHQLITAADVTERNRARELEHTATHDPLTNLPNRLLLRERLRATLDRKASAHPHSAVLFIDLDHFKEINDTLGHDAGDELLRLVGARLKRHIRSTDTLARFGGDEFVVLLDHLEDATEAERIADKLVRHTCMPFLLSRGQEVRIGASVGISIFTPEANDADLLVRQADTALYAAKSSGRNTFRVFDPALESAYSTKLP